MPFASRRLQSHQLRHLLLLRSMISARHTILQPMLPIARAGIALRRASVPIYPLCRDPEHAVLRVLRLDGTPVSRHRDRLRICPGRPEAGSRRSPRDGSQKRGRCHRHYPTGIHSRSRRQTQYLDSKRQHIIEGSCSRSSGRMRSYAKGCGTSSIPSGGIGRDRQR